MNVLIINLTRFGDLLQTQPVISGYARQGHTVGVVCLSNFASAASLLRDVGRVFTFQGAKLLSNLDQDWREAVKLSETFRAEVRESFKPDVVVNLTPSVAARMLARGLADQAEVRGFGVDRFGFNADSSAWAAFLQLAGNNRGASPFNICDLFQRAAGLRTPGASLNLARPSDAARQGLAGVFEPRGNYLALQLGASEERRQWPVERFAALAEACAKEFGLVPVLLGAESERPLGERFRSCCSIAPVDLMGRTTFDELAAALDRCRVLVTNDTGTMHLAAGLAVPMVSIFLATAQPWDTGPYRQGALCLEPDMDCHPCGFGVGCERQEACRTGIPAEAVMAQVRGLLKDQRPEHHAGVRVWRTVFSEDGLLTLESLSGHNGSERTSWIRMQRHFLRGFLDGEAVVPGGLGLPMGGMRDGIIKTLTEAKDILFLLSQQGALLVVNPRPAAKSKFMATWQRLQNILHGNSSLNILGLMWNFESQLHGESLGDLLEVVGKYHMLFQAMLEDLETRHES